MIQHSAVATDYHLLPSSLRSAIEDARADADAERRLPNELAETLRASGAFRISTPVEYGGAELSLAAAAQVYEAFGRIDGPVACGCRGRRGTTAPGSRRAARSP